MLVLVLFPRLYLGGGKKNTSQSQQVNLILIHIYQILALLFMLLESDFTDVLETVQSPKFYILKKVCILVIKITVLIYNLFQYVSNHLFFNSINILVIWILTPLSFVYVQHFNFQLMHTTLKNIELLEHFKIRKTAPTCFGLQGNNHQGATVST